MRIVLMGNSYQPIVGGIETSMMLFRRGLQESGHHVYVIAPASPGFEDRELGVFRIPAMPLPPPLRGALALPLKSPLVTVVRGIRPSLIHSQHPFWLGRTAAALAQEMRIPLIYTYHTRYDAYAPRYMPLAPMAAARAMKRMMAHYMRQCSHVIAPTPSIRDAILKEYETSVPVTVVPTPVDLGAYERLDRLKVRYALGLQDAEVLLYLGRLDREKGLDLTLRAFSIVAAQRPRAHLLLVGKGQAREGLERLAGELRIGHRVTFAGAVDHDEVPHYAAAADVFVFSSTTETQGLSLVEAMAAGTPVVAVDAPGPQDILAEGGGIIVPSDTDAFARAVIALLADEQQRGALGQEALRIAGGYSIRSATERLLSVYERAVATKAAQ